MQAKTLKIVLPAFLNLKKLVYNEKGIKISKAYLEEAIYYYVF